MRSALRQVTAQHVGSRSGVRKFTRSRSYFEKSVQGAHPAHVVLDRRSAEHAFSSLFRANTTPHKTRGPGILLTCEHASQVLPPPYSFKGGDERLIGQHWAFDPGARDFTDELAQALGCVAVLSNFSRLLIDPNRPLSSDTLIRTSADGQAVNLNDALTATEELHRIMNFYVPFHLELGRVAKQIEPALLISIHSFTQNYEGSMRDFEIGVLYSSSDGHAANIICQDFQDAGFTAKINEPWSGKDGFQFSADSVKYALAPGKSQAIMLEFRNDVLVDAGWRKAAVECLTNSITTTLHKLYCASHKEGRGWSA